MALHVTFVPSTEQHGVSALVLAVPTLLVLRFVQSLK